MRKQFLEYFTDKLPVDEFASNIDHQLSDFPQPYHLYR